MLFKEGSNRDLLRRHHKGAGGEDLVVGHQAAGLELVARVRSHSQCNGVACFSGALVCRHRTVDHLCNGDAIALCRCRSFASRKGNIVNGRAGAGLGTAFKHKGKPRTGLAVIGRDGNTACAGHILRGVLLVDLTHVVLGVPYLRPGLPLVQAGLDRKTQGAGRKLGVAGSKGKAHLHAVLHVDLGQDQQLVLGGAAHVVRRADRRVAAPILIAGDLPGLVVIIGTGALHSPSGRELVAVVEVLGDAVRQGHGLFGEGRGDGVGLGDVFKGVGVHRTLGLIVHFDILNLIIGRWGDGEGLAAVFLNGHRAAGGDAALSGGGGDGKGLCGGRGGLAAAHGGELHIIDQNRAATGIADLSLIAECKLYIGCPEIIRNLNSYIRSFCVIGNYTGHQLICN